LRDVEVDADEHAFSGEVEITYGFELWHGFVKKGLESMGMVMEARIGLVFAEKRKERLSLIKRVFKTQVPDARSPIWFPVR
jgi:hypothetical protein